MGGIGTQKVENHCQLAPISQMFNTLVVICALGMHLQEMKDRNWGNCQATTADQFPLPNFKPPKLSEEMGFSFPFRDSPSVISIQIPIHPFCPALHHTAAYPADTREPWFSLQIRLNQMTWSKTDWYLSGSVKRRYPFALRGLMVVVMRVAYCAAKIKGLPPSCANRRQLYVFWNNLFQRPNSALVSPYRYKGIRSFDTIATPVSLI